MTFTNEDQHALTDNWDQAKGQVSQQFPQVSDDDLEQFRHDPKNMPKNIADRTGQDKGQVEQTLSQIAGQYN